MAARGSARVLGARLASAVWLLSAQGCSAHSGPTASEPSAELDTSPPNLAELRELLRDEAQHAFTEEEQARGCPSGQTIAEYLTMLDENTQPDASDPGGTRELTGGCDIPFGDALSPEADPALWTCTVKAHVVDAAGESPWTYELRIRVRREDRTLDTRWIACPGAS